MTVKMRGLDPDPNGVVTRIGPVEAPAGTVATITLGLRTEKLAATPLKVTDRV